MADEVEYEIRFVIDGIHAKDPREAALIVADILVSGYAHRGVYEVVRRHDEQATTVDLSEEN